VKDRAVRHFRTKYVVGKEEYIRLDRQLEEERAAKISLQQDAAHRRARQQAVKRRWMTVGIMAGLGLIAMAAGAPLTYQHLYGLGWESMRQRYWGFPASGYILGIALAAMATAPTDDTSIRVCSAVAVMAQVGNTFGFGVYAVMHFTGMHRPKYDAPAVGTIMAWLALFYSVASLVSVALFFSVFRVRRHEGISLSNVVRKTVSTFGRTAGIAVMLLLFPVVWAAAQPSSSFRIERLAAYRRLWTVTRGLFGTWGVGTTIAGCACVLVDAPWDTHLVVPSVLLLAAMELLLAAVGLSTPVRKRVQAWVSRVGAGSTMRAAAGVAALVGTLRPEKALALARERFCALPFDVLRQADFNTNEDTGLNEKSVPMQLGQCDAFISHSWSDSGDLKFAALNRWAVRFSVKFGSTAHVWLDKACIKQGTESSISEQLACLPIFLAGCKEVLVLAGPTFTKRLWCVIELFTFLKMGGSMDRLNVIPISEEDIQVGDARRRSSRGKRLFSEDDGAFKATFHVGKVGGDLALIRKQFKTFDAKKAKCFKLEDRERLLSVIETGFGSLDDFNMLVSSLFDQSEVRSLTLQRANTTRVSLRRGSLRRTGSMSCLLPHVNTAGEVNASATGQGARRPSTLAVNRRPSLQEASRPRASQPRVQVRSEPHTTPNRRRRSSCGLALAPGLTALTNV